MRKAPFTLSILLLICLFLIPNVHQAQTWSSGPSTLYTNPTTTRIGIGTTSPYYSYQMTLMGAPGKHGIYAKASSNTYYAGYFGGNLGVTGDIKGLETSGIFSIYGSTSDSNGPYFRLYGRYNNSRPGGMSVVAYDQGTIEFFSRTSNSWAKHMTINPTGKVNIGTSSTPTYVGGANINAYKLFVKGGILSDEVRVRTGWADYVFEEDYELKSLTEVAAHIEEKGYLHNTPSAAQVEVEGIEIGEMTKNQQEKIEEIFLHLIALEKRIDQLEAENKSLKTTLKAQR